MTTLITTATVESWCGASAGDAVIAILHPAVEKQLQEKLRRNLGTQPYTHERYDGSGGRTLLLDNWPITSISRVSIGTRTAFTLGNSSTDASNALVEVSSTGITLTLSGGANAHAAQAFTFAAYATMATLIAAINTYAHGWTATVSDTAYNSYPSSDLLPVLGGYGLGASALDMEMPEEPAEGFTYTSDGRLVLPYSIWPAGNQNIIVTYTAGYITGEGANLPDDLKMLILGTVKEMYDRHKSSSENLKSYSIGNVSKTFGDITERDWVRDIIARYRRPLL